jgi:sugar lactone lactonase YvrE
VVGLARPALAQDASPESGPGGEAPGLPPLPEGAVVVAEGLYNPGHLTFGADGTLYIAETGVFGEGPTEPGEGATPEAAPVSAAPMVVPAQISQVAPDGTVSVLTAEAGGIGIGFFEGSVYVAHGGGSVGSGMIPLPEENTVRAVDVATGEVRLVAELGSYEADNNPDGTDVNPNLYGLDIADDGTIYVADAGGNTIYAVNSETGDFSLFAIVPDLTQLTGSTPTPEEQAMQPGPRQAVPTSVVIDEAGNIVVFYLSEAWNGPSVLSFTADGTYSVLASNLSMVVGAAQGPDGAFYFTQLTADFSGEMPAPGAVYRLTADGTPEPVVEGLFLPQGIAFDGDGNLYVTTNSVFLSAPGAPAGMVVRFDGVAAMM